MRSSLPSCSSWIWHNMIVLFLLPLLWTTLYSPVEAKKRQPPFLPFNNTNPYENGWCPNAKCQNSPLCSPCHRRFLFIVATARSGSTTLLSMFNMLPNVRLAGENYNELYIASLIESNLNQNTKLLQQSQDILSGAYMHNGIPAQAMACSIQHIFHTLNPPPYEVQHHVHLPGQPSLEQYDEDRIFGLKTVKIHYGDWTPQQAAEFFQENFPCSRFIVNIRSNITNQIETRKKFGWKEVNPESLEAHNEFLVNFAKVLGYAKAKLIIMEEWTNNVSILNSILQWLGYSQDCQFQAIVHENAHHGFGSDRKTERNIGGEKCRYDPPH